MKKTKQIPLNKTLQLMIKWSEECGDILRKHLISSYSKPLKVIDKGIQGLATEADLISEKYVLKQIKKHFPEHIIISEEDAFSKKLKVSGNDEDRYVWLIDPLDGTNNFYNRLPLFCVSLALCKGSETILGVVYNPMTEDLFYAIKGKGAFVERKIGNKKLKKKLKLKSKKINLSDSIISTNFVNKNMTKEMVNLFTQVRGTRRLGSAALEMCYVAAGMLDAYWEYNLSPWDLAAAGLICQETGLVISDIEGNSYSPFKPSIITYHPNLMLEEELLLKR